MLAGTSATAQIANLPTQAEAGAVMGTAFIESGAHFSSPKVASAGAHRGLKASVVADYAGRDGDGLLAVVVADYGSASAAATAMRATARGLGIRLKQVESAVKAPSPWGSHDVWAGTTGEGDLGLIAALAGSRLIAFRLAPPAGAWDDHQWQRAWEESIALQQRLMSTSTSLTMPAYLGGDVPTAAPAQLSPVVASTRSRDGWLAFAKPSTAFYQSMRPLTLALQYAMVGAAPQLLLEVHVTPTSSPALAQEFIATLGRGTEGADPYSIEGLPHGARTIAYAGESGIDALQTDFVGDGALIDITCANITLAPQLQSALDACVRGTQALAETFADR